MPICGLALSGGFSADFIFKYNNTVFFFKAIANYFLRCVFDAVVFKAGGLPQHFNKATDI